MRKQIFATVVGLSARNGDPTITITTAALDRDGDEIVPEGATLAPYLKNPVVLFGHDYRSLPVGTTTHLDVVPGVGIRASWRWLENDPMADRVRNAFEQGVLRAASVGFIPLASEPNGGGGRRFTEWELTEWSLCPVPANPEAVRTLKSLGLTVRDEDVLTLDEDDVLAVSDWTVADSARMRLRQAQADPLGDPAAWHHVNVTAADVANAIRPAVRAVLAEVVGDEVRRAVAHAVGRVD